MYYNITIRTLDSEFSLKSQNRSIIEREMDAYFAYFFDASEEFISKIKKVEINKENLVSIDEIDKPDINEQRIDKQTANELSTNEQATDAQSANEQSVNESNTNETNVNESSVNEPNANEPNTNEPNVNEQIVNEPGNNNKPSTNESGFNEQLTESTAIELCDDKSSVEEQEIEYYESSQDFDSSYDDLNEPSKEAELISRAAQFKEDKHESKADADNEVKEALVFKNEPLYEKTGPALKFADYVFTNEPAPQPPQKVDFNLFLKGFIISDISNQFIACVFYIKNILNQQGASLKVINGYLIKAAGNIADMSVVSDLINKNFISYRELDGAKKYYITTVGEEYFSKKYQG